jgi:hypothetical protein
MAEEKTLEQRIAALEAELKEAKEAKEAAEKAAEPFKPKKPWPKYDPTEGFRLPASAAGAMARVVPDPPAAAGFNAHAHAQTKPGVPSGFGAPRTEPAKLVERGTGWVEPQPLGSVPGLKYVTN